MNDSWRFEKWRRQGLSGTYFACRWTENYFGVLRGYLEKKIYGFPCRGDDIDPKDFVKNPMHYYDDFSYYIPDRYRDEKFKWTPLKRRGHILFQETEKICKKLGVVIEKLSVNLNNEIDNKIKEVSETRQSVRGVRGCRKEDLYDVDLKKVLEQTLAKLKLPVRPTKYITSASRVAPHYFLGLSPRLEQESAYNIYKDREIKNIHASKLYYDGRRGCIGSWETEGIDKIIKAYKTGIDVSTIRKQREIMEKSKVHGQPSKNQRSYKVR